MYCVSDVRCRATAGDSNSAKAAWPAFSLQRFRYKCESKSAGSLLGEGSTNEQKVYPTVEVDFHFLCWISVSDFQSIEVYADRFL